MILCDRLGTNPSCKALLKFDRLEEKRLRAREEAACGRKRVRERRRGCGRGEEAAGEERGGGGGGGGTWFLLHLLTL